MKTAEYSLAELAEHLNATMEGDAELCISGIGTLQSATKQQISFLANPKYLKYLSDTSAGAVILSEEAAKQFEGNKLIHSNPYLAYAKLSQLWSKRNIRKTTESSIHETAIIASNAQLGEGVVIGPRVVIEDNAVIGDKVVIGANCIIGEDSVLGQGTYLYPNVTLYHQVTIGCDCTIQSGVVLGSDGFGFAPSPEGWIAIAQLGGVSIGNRVEIGANTTVDRGALDDTVISDGVILDNQVQIAHNVQIGENSAVAACTGIAGSTTVGKNVIIGGATGIAGHLTIADGVQLTGMTMVTKSITEPGVYSSGTGVQSNDQWRKTVARLRQLDKLVRRVSKLEKDTKN